MGQNETKICLHLPKKELKLRPDLKAGNKTRGQGQQEKQCRNNKKHSGCGRKKKKNIKPDNEKMSLIACNERLTIGPTSASNPQSCSAQGLGEGSQGRNPNM